MVHTLQPNGYYLSCDTCNDGTAELQVTGAYGSLQYAWAQVPEEYVDGRLEGASMFERLDSDDVDPTDLFGGNVPFVIGSSTQQTGFSPEVMYAGFAMDELGCFGGEGFMLEKPNGVANAPQAAWGLYGNDANGAIIPPSGGGGAAWLGTNDSTDFVMKANNQPQLRLGADGVTELMQQFRLSAFNDLTAEPLRIPAMGPDGTFLTALDPDMIFDEVNPCKVNSNGLHIPRWVSGESKIFTDCNPVNVGIGTNNPLAKLDVRGQTYSQTLSVNTYAQDAKVTIKGGQPGTQNQFKALEVQDTGGEATLRVFNDGKVVIGKGTYANTGETPIFLIQNDGQQILKVNNDGLVWAREIKLSLDVFPDYVFNDGYNLMPIEDLHNFISTKGHLPNVPQEKEIVDNGLNVSELISIQMEKIEELTLYIIQLNERIIELESKHSISGK